MEQHRQKKRSLKSTTRKGVNDFARYSGIAFQMIAIILVTTWAGIKIDKLAGFHRPVFAIVLSLFGVFAAIYAAIKDFIK